MLTQRFCSLFSLISFFSALKSIPVVLCRVQCQSNVECEVVIGKNSECLSGFCTNPYHRGGCLSSRLQNYDKVRTCNSEDPSSAVEKGYCVPSSFDYTEVRIATQNWDSAIFSSWILQIILSELTGVPVTLETGTANANVNFYDLNTSYDYGLANNWDQFRVSKVVKDCRMVKSEANYTACAHVYPEVWPGNQIDVQQLLTDDAIEAPGDLGFIGNQFWFVRLSTGKRYPELLSYVGLQGPEARTKLATIFKRPTTWADYCNFVSKNDCQVPDGHALRAPTPDEAGQYYDATYFKGYFRATEKNNCTGNPNCTGHIVDFPCGWESHVAQQTYYNDIGLESDGHEPFSNGYTYDEMTQIWTAADALDEDVIMLWWYPETFYQKFSGTSSKFVPVTLPPPTQECLEHRVTPKQRCEADPVVRLGDPLGSCADDPGAISKVIGKALYEISSDPSTPEALHSPAYNIIKNYDITGFQVAEIFDAWFAIDKDQMNLDPRDAVCDWVVKNLDEIEKYVPDGYPRVLVNKESSYNQPVFLAALVLACIALCAVVMAAMITCMQRKKSVVRYAQIEFLLLLLLGLLLVSSGAVMASQPPTNSVCVAVVWFVNIGYAVELVPLVVKVAAINKQMVAYRQMQRVQLRISALLGIVFLGFFLVGIILLVWTVTDPPKKEGEFSLTGNKNQHGEIIVEQNYACTSNSVWFYINIGWQVLLLLVASVLVFQTRNIREDLNETKTLSIMIYAHFLFVVALGITYFLGGTLGQWQFNAVGGIICSLDVIVALAIYFAPKFLQKEEEDAKELMNMSPGLPDSSMFNFSYSIQAHSDDRQSHNVSSNFLCQTRIECTTKAQLDDLTSSENCNS